MQQQHSQTFISCLAWVHPGFAARIPRQIELTQQEIEQLKTDPLYVEQLNSQINQQNNQEQVPIFSTSMKQHIQNGYPQGIEDLSDQDLQDYYIRPTDHLIVAGKVEKQYSSLEIYIYEKQSNNLFVHHEIMLTSFPLAIQWLKVSLGTVGGAHQEKGNYAIVSSFLPQIEIWNLDLVQAIQPDLILGGQVISKKKKPKKFGNNSKKWKQGSHTDSVLSLSLNAVHHNILASGSSDTTVKFWDLQSQKNIYTCTHHKNRVNKVKWNPQDPSVIFTCSEDKSIAILDSRYTQDKIFHNINPKQSIQSACWNHNCPSQIAYTTDIGNLYIFDAKMPNKTLVNISAHPKSSITDVIIGSKNILYTCSEDQTVKIWNLQSMQEPIAMKRPKCGKLFCMDLIEKQDGPILGVGNQKGQLFIWEVTENQKVDQQWKK